MSPTWAHHGPNMGMPTSFFLFLGPIGPQVGLMLALFSALGPLLGNMGASWGPSWTHVAFLARFFTICSDFGLIFIGFGKVWGWFWECFFNVFHIIVESRDF